MSKPYSYKILIIAPLEGMVHLTLSNSPSLSWHSLEVVKAWVYKLVESSISSDMPAPWWQQ